MVCKQQGRSSNTVQPRRLTDTCFLEASDDHQQRSDCTWAHLHRSGNPQYIWSALRCGIWDGARLPEHFPVNTSGV